MPERNLVSIFPERGTDKIFQKITLGNITVANTDTPVFGGYEKTTTVTHNYGKIPWVYMETSTDQSNWYPSGMGKKSYSAVFNLYMLEFAGRWVSTTSNVTFTFFVNTSNVPLTLYYRAVFYANQ